MQSFRAKGAARKSNLLAHSVLRHFRLTAANVNSRQGCLVHQQHAGGSIRTLSSLIDVVRHAGNIGETRKRRKSISMPFTAACRSEYHTTRSRENGVFETTETVLLHVHNWTGLPWYGTIFFSTIAFRLLFTPVVYYQVHAAENVRKASSDIKEANRTWERLAGNRNFKTTMLYLQTMYVIKKKHNIQLVPLFFNPIFVQIPAFIIFFMTMRRMIRNADSTSSELAQGGIFWFDNLTIPDPTYVLPAVAIGTFLFRY